MALFSTVDLLAVYSLFTKAFSEICRLIELIGSVLSGR